MSLKFMVNQIVKKRSVHSHSCLIFLGRHYFVYGRIVILQRRVEKNILIVKSGNFMFVGCIYCIFNMLVLFRVYILPCLNDGLTWLGCGEMFATNDGLKDHYAVSHIDVDKVSRKRKFEDDITPIIEAMPADVARRNRAVYDGPSRSLSISQGRIRKRGKG